MRERSERGTRQPWLWVREWERRAESEGAEMKTLDLKTQTLALTKMGFVYICVYAVVLRGFVIAPLIYGFISQNAEGFEPDVHTWAAWNLE